MSVDGSIRATPATVSAGKFDWGNSGTAYGTCTNGGIHAVGTNGLFDCGKANPISGRAPLAATFIPPDGNTLGRFVVDALANKGHRDLGNLCVGSTTVTTDLDPTTFTTSSKNGDSIGSYTYGPGTLTPKDDIGNIYAIAHNTPSVSEVYFGGERVINNGDSHFDFEFLQQSVTLVPSAPGSCSGTFIGGRTAGDLLASMDFTIGGTFGGASVHEWLCDNSGTTQQPVGTHCNPGSTNAGDPNWNPHYEDITGTATVGALQVAVNASGPVACGGWVCRDEIGTNPSAVSTNEFMEGGINLGSLGFTGCFSTFLPHTRSSQSFTAQLKDFAGPVGFNTCSMTTSPAQAVTDIRSGGITDTATVSGFAGAPGTVDFKLYGPFSSSAAIGTSSCTSANLVFDSGATHTTDTGSPAHYSSGTSSAPPGIGVYQWVAAYSTGGQVAVTGACGDTSEQATVVDANIQISPATFTNAVGTNHVLVAHVNISSGTSFVNAPANTTINFTVANSNGATAIPASGSCLTIDVTGTCTFMITSPTAGTTTINAATDVMVDGLPLHRATGDGGTGDSANAGKTWVDANIQISPANASNAVGTPHLLTAHVNINDGTGFVNAPAGTVINFSVVSGTGTLSAASCTTVGTTGSCSDTLSSATAGNDVVNATTTVTITPANGLPVTLTRSTGDANAGDSPNANKTWVDANIQISPANASNAVGTPHLLTAHVNINDGTGFVNAPAGTVINFSVVSGTGTLSAASCTTVGTTGNCSDTLSSATAGNDVVNATTTVTITPANGLPVTLTRSTGDANAGDSPNANKTWVDANIQISPASASNPVGTTHVLTATVKVNDGTGFVLAPDGTSITFSIVSGPGSFVAPSTCTTSGATGSCTATITSNVVGTTEVKATTTVTITPANGLPVTLTRSTGDANVGDSSDALKTWNPFHPSITTSLGAATILNSGTVTDTATLTGSSGASTATGAITISVYSGSGASACVAGNLVTSMTASPATAGDGSYTATFSGLAAGNYEFQASFAGDAFDLPATSACGSEPLLVQNQPSITTSLSASSINLGDSVTDTATLSGATSNATGVITINVYTGSDASACVAANLVQSKTASPATNGNGAYTATLSGLAVGSYEFQATYAGDTFNKPATSACGTEPLTVKNPQVSQITPTTTTCSQFSGGTSATLSTVQYSTKSGVISQVDPGVFFYWVKLTSVGSGSQTFTITQSNTGLPIANTSNIFLIGAGSNAFDSNCNTLATKVTQDPKTGAVTVTFNAGSGGTIFIGIKYSTSNVVGESVPVSGEIWTYVFSTTGVAGSTSNITLSPKF